MTHLKRKLMMTLVALLALTTHAWADEQSESFTTATSGQLIYTGEHFTITGDLSDSDGLWIGNRGGGDKTVTIESKNGENITKIEAVLGYEQNWGDTKLATTSGEVMGTYEVGQTITISSVNATTVTLSGPEGEFKLIQFKSWKIYYGSASSATAVPLTWDATAKTATLTNGMPAGNVTASVEYFPQAEFAESSAPAAIADVPANTDDPIVTPGTVANIGASEVKQGTLMYFVSQPTGNTDPVAPDYDTEGWSENVPTANGLQQGNAYVWYYIKGAEPANIADRSDDNTFSDSDIKPLGTTGFVTLAPEPTYNVEFAEGTNPEAPAEPIWTASPATGVKKGTPVTVTYTGTRKVIGVKAEKKAAAPATALAPALENGATVVIAFNYGGANTCTFTNNNGTFTLTSGTGAIGGNGNSAKQLTIENGNIVFKANYYSPIDNDWDSAGFQVTFDPTANSYAVWKSGIANSNGGAFTSISVNDTDITSTLSELK